MNYSQVRTNCAAAIFGLLLWFLFVNTGRTQNSGTWEKRAPMPLSRQELATAVLSGKLSVIGGYDAFRASTVTVQVYNPTTNTWTLAHPVPFPVSHNAAAVAGGNLYRKVETPVWLFLCPRSAA